jgi:hypothetical protein
VVGAEQAGTAAVRGRSRLSGSTKSAAHLQRLLRRHLRRRVFRDQGPIL